MNGGNIAEQSSTSQFILILPATGGVLVAAGLAGLDRLIAKTSNSEIYGSALLSWLVGLLDLITLKEISNFLLGALLIVIAISSNAWKKQRLMSGPVLYVGLVQFVTTLTADLSKPLFGRMRPYESVGDGTWSDIWFAGLDFGSFPSGHVAFYLGLCAPLALLHRKFAVPLLVMPGLVGIQRMSSHDHYATDVGAAVLICCSVMLLFRRVEGRGRTPSLPAAA